MSPLYQRDNFIDILKGLAIISIVQCHAAWVLPISGFPIGDFTCTFHVSSFVFAAGFLFRGVENGDQYYRHLGKRFGKLVYLFFSYSAAFVLLNRLFLALHIVPEEQRIPVLKGLYQALLMDNTQSLLYSFWFVPMFLICSCVFVSVFYLANRQKTPVLWHGLFAAVCALAGIYGIKQQLFMRYSSEVALLLVPVMYGGYLACRFRRKLVRFTTWWAGFAAAAVLLFILRLYPGRIELSSGLIMSPLLFYPVTALAIYMACCFAKGLSRVPVLSGILACAGRNSFHIMALHLLGFKILDVFYGFIMGLDPAVYEAQPRAFDFWYLYLIFGTAFSLALAWLGKRLIVLAKRKSLVLQ